MNYIFSVLSFVALLLFFVYKSKRVNTESISESQPRVGNESSESGRVCLRTQFVLQARLHELMTVEKAYRNKDLSLFELARKLNTNSSYLSAHINKQYKCNFNVYVNAFRTKEACEILVYDASNKLSIDQVADLVGFSSRRAFYASFKRELNCSPAQFKKNSLV